MSPEVVQNILVGLFVLLMVLDWLVYWNRPADYEWFQFYFAPVEIAIGLVIAGSCIALGVHWLAAMYLAGAAATFYNWWKRNNRRRKKLADKLAGRVIVIGGLLKVVVPARGSA